MKHIYAFETKREYEKYEELITTFEQNLKEYQLILEKDFELNDLPKGIVWTSQELAINVFSDVPIPAFTNKDTIYISPDLRAWKKLFIQQLDGKSFFHIQHFYEKLSENHILTILGHELTHHSDLFLDEFGDEREGSIWFEEGMCEYLPRKYLLTEKEFDEISTIEKELVDIFTKEYGNRSIDEFGSNSYTASLSSIMFDYWRSFLSVKCLVENRYQNNIKAVFEAYHQWDKEGRKLSLAEYFRLDKTSI